MTRRFPSVPVPLCRACAASAFSTRSLWVGFAAILCSTASVARAQASTPAPHTPLFAEQAQAVGLDFVHFNGMSGAYYFPETMGAGAALLDYDNDGDLDLYLVQGRMLGTGKQADQATFPPPSGTPLGDRLFRNDLTVAADGSRTLRFTDVTAAAGIRAGGYGMGVATGDVDNNGWTDLYVTNFGPNQLWRNNGDGSFTDIAPAAGADVSRDPPPWSVPASFFDYDRDGRLDLYIGHYVDFRLDRNKSCFSPSGARDYCSPLSYNPQPDTLLHNLGMRDGRLRFEDVSDRSGIHRDYGGALGVVAADFNADGLPDVYVGNDGLPNQLWIQQPDGRFTDQAFLSGVAVNMDGATEASMGVEAADFDADGDLDLFMTHLLGETNTLYINDGHGWFEDRSLSTGLAAPSKAYTAFGTAWTDLDNDGWQDLFIANGDVKAIAALARQGDPYPLRQPNQLFMNRGQGRFEEVSAFEPAVTSPAEVSRGVVHGDIDNDGDIDLLVTNNSGPVRLLINTRGNRNRWLGLRLLDRHGRDALGARAALVVGPAGDAAAAPETGAGPAPRQQWRRVHTDGSYACASDPRLLFGLGARSGPVQVRVFWPDGATETWAALAANRYHTLHRGQGQSGDTP
jgi:hypothetical protein